MTETNPLAPVPPPAATTPAPVASSETAPPGPAAGFNMHGNALSPAQLAQMAGWMKDAGHITQEQADEASKANGADAVAPGSAPAADANAVGAPIDAAAQAEFDRVFPPGKPADYTLPPLEPNERGVTPALIEADKQIRGYLAAAEFPAAIGSAVAAEAVKVAPMWERMNPNERTLWERSQRAEIHKMFGDQTEARIAMAQRLVVEIENETPGLVRVLEESGAGSSAAVVVQCALQAERFFARRAVSKR